MATIKARVGSQNTVRVLSNVSSSASRIVNLVDVNSDLKTIDGMLLVWDLSSETFIMTSVIDSSSTTIEGIAYFNNTEDSSLPTNGALVVSGGVGVGKNLTVGAGLSVAGITTFNSDLDINASVNVLNDLTVQGLSTFVGDVTFRGGTIGIGDSTSDNINVTGEFVSNLVPNLNNTYDIGTTAQKWRDGKFSGIVTTNNLYVSGVSTIVGNQTIGNSSLASDLRVYGIIEAYDGLFYEVGDFSGPNGIAYFDNNGELISAESSESELLSTSEYILTTKFVVDTGYIPVWTTTIDGGEF